ncbi:MAG: hypothetical protein JXA09_07590, partial [Anaerolineae bacterium]|nr:hypothetical protein [Anaerolineae bacterium]
MNRRIVIALLVVLGLVGLSAVVWAPPLFQDTPPAVVEDPAVDDPPPEAPTPVPVPEVHTLFVSVRDAGAGGGVPGAAVTVGGVPGSSDEGG